MNAMWSLGPGDIERLLDEDLPYGDLTTRALGLNNRRAHMDMRSRSGCTLSGLEAALRMARHLGLHAEACAAAGVRCEPGETVARFAGPADAVLAGWKQMQVLVEWASGIATATRALVDTARSVNESVVIAATRKTAPLTRRLSMQAVLDGGGTLHRTGLSDSVLLFPEHRRLLGDETLATSLARLRRLAPERTIVVEVGDLDTAREAIEAGADVVQLEKFTPEAVAQVVDLARTHRPPVRVAAAGGIHLGNVAHYAASGAQLLVTSSPYLAAPRDIAVSIEALT